MIELARQIWAVLSPVHNQIFSLIFTFLGAVVFWFARPKVKLTWGRSNNSIHFIQTNDAKTEIYCEKYFIQNSGRKPSSEVQFIMSYKPDDFSIFPAREYSEASNPEGHYIAKIPYVAPHELIIIDVVYIQKRAAIVNSVHCNEMIGKNVNFFTVRHYSNYVYMTIRVLLFFGASFFLQLLLNLILGE